MRLPNAIERRLRRRSRTPAPSAEVTRNELEERRERLAEEVAGLYFDLGGLAYEMAIRDHFRLDVLTRRAAVLQERDAELAEVERLLRLEREGAAGTCRSCGALYARGAAFCWRCGEALMEGASPPHHANGSPQSPVLRMEVR